jgi:hypothetical protein
MVKVYVASSWRNKYQQDVVRVLRSAGHVVYDFKNPDPSDPTNEGFRWHEVDPEWTSGGLVTAERWRRMVDHPRAINGHQLDYRAMQIADVCVFVLPAGRSASFEMGWCMGQGKRGVVVCLEPTEPELMFREAVIVGSLADMLDAVEGKLVNPEENRNCRSCAHSGMEPDDLNLTCFHPDAGTFGQYIRSEPLPHCGSFVKWKPHPRRTPEGGLCPSPTTTNP